MWYYPSLVSYYSLLLFPANLLDFSLFILQDSANHLNLNEVRCFQFKLSKFLTLAKEHDDEDFDLE